MGYRSCLGIIRLAEQYSGQRMEAAAERALLAQACRYQSVKSILKNSLDAVPLSPAQPNAMATVKAHLFNPPNNLRHRSEPPKLAEIRVKTAVKWIRKWIGIAVTNTSGLRIFWLRKQTSRFRLRRALV